MCGWQSNLSEKQPKNQIKLQQQQRREKTKKPKKQSQLDIYLSCQNVWLAIKSIKPVGKTQTTKRQLQKTKKQFEKT
jgi:hypothetical protein